MLREETQAPPSMLLPSLLLGLVLLIAGGELLVNGAAILMRYAACILWPGLHAGA